MKFLGALRLLVLGETWTVPLGVLALIVGCAALRTTAPELWRDAGGFILLGGVIAVLTASQGGRRLAGGARKRDDFLSRRRHNRHELHD